MHPFNLIEATYVLHGGSRRHDTVAINQRAARKQRRYEGQQHAQGVAAQDTGTIQRHASGSLNPRAFLVIPILTHHDWLNEVEGLTGRQQCSTSSRSHARLHSTVKRPFRIDTDRY
jgi:hypothetical protein